MRECLLAIVSAPSPLRINSPQGNVRENDDGCAALQMGHIFFEPGELLGAEGSEAASFEVHDIYKTDEVGAFRIEAVPAIADGISPEAFTKHFAVVVQNVMLAGNVEDSIGFEALERFRERVELLRLGEVGQIAGGEDEGWGCGESIYLGDGFAQSCGDVGVGCLVETDMAIADLNETQIAFQVADVFAHNVAKSE